jgi:tetratricopeptide (TPR) repeat protein
VLDRHAWYYLHVAEEAARDFGSAKQARVVALLEHEHDNLRAALKLCVAHQEAALGVRLGAALAPFWLLHGHLTEGREWLLHLLALPGSDARAASRAEALSGAGWLALRQSDFAAARTEFEASLAIRRELGDVPGVATCLTELGVLADDEGDYASAVSLHEQSLALRRQLDDPPRIAASLNNLGAAIAHRAMVASVHDRGTVQEHQAGYALARRLLEEGLAIRGAHHDLQWIAGSLMNLGYLTDCQGEDATAWSAYEQGLAISRELGDRESIGWALEGLSMLAAAQGHAARALRLGGAAAAVRELLGTVLPFAERELHRYRLVRVRHLLGGQAADAAWAEGRTWSLDEAITYALQPVSRS